MGPVRPVLAGRTAGLPRREPGPGESAKLALPAYANPH